LVDSDSDSSVEHNTNRGYKLKKRARFVKQGTLASTMSPAAYKEVRNRYPSCGGSVGSELTELRPLNMPATNAQSSIATRR
jgi:hypothetical protein